MDTSRSWMYARKLPNGLLNPEFLSGLEAFINFACSKPEFMDGSKIRCPCAKCINRKYLLADDVKFHLVSKGFRPNYLKWTAHGESLCSSTYAIEVNVPRQEHFHGDTNPYRNMVFDVAGPHFQNAMADVPSLDNEVDNMEELPNPESKKFYDMLKATEEELWPSCERHSQLSAVARMLHIKSENHLSEKCYDQIVNFVREVLPDENKFVDSFYKTKKLIRGLGLPGNDNILTECKFCGLPRYKPRRGSSKTNVAWKRMYYFPLTPRLQRLYASEATAAKMRWHAEHDMENDVMCHPSDSEAWKHFNRTHPMFSAEIRNVRLGLCTDGFQPFGQSGQQYSCWPVIITPYNLPPGMCMKEPYLFLSIIVSGPQNPKHRLDVYLQPLIVELTQLWHVGVQTYDASKKQNFQMYAALMWTISDFPSYSMLSGWSTAGRLACPYCVDYSDAFSLSHGGKISWFDSHRKFLPQNHPFRRNRVNFLKGKACTNESPPILSSEDTFLQIEDLGLRRVTDSDGEAINATIARNTIGEKGAYFGIYHIGLPISFDIT
ncbi:uncharacterized protein LOC131180116 [Hevea brasiliensis]|uniref:uncharacterized protein LOC131180116 n=1 Tax=Hevea brasiliensis TaxID=3981 RepID=UPI0025DEA20C|nr:uncharacterized protein LOC131180116 [Hevea brasiliensis]